MKALAIPFVRPLFVTAFVIASTFVLRSSPDSADVVLKTISGDVDCSVGQGVWEPLRLDTKLGDGSIIRTRDASTVDFYLQESKTTLRLTPNSTLEIQSLRTWRAEDQDVTDTTLKLLEGGIVGSQRKIAKPSHFEIQTPRSVASIVGTEYVVRADGAVTVLSGSVSVNYNLPGNQGSVQVDVSAGQSFDPATGTVVPTTAEYLANSIADIDTVKMNAEVFKTGGATVVVKADQKVSPTTPNGNNGVGNGVDPQPPGNPPINDGPGTSPGNPGNKGGVKAK